MARPRKPTANTKSKGVTVWLTPDDHAALMAKAADAGVSVSAYLAAAAQKRPLAERQAAAEDSPGMFALADAVRRVGNNVNQFAREFHRSGRYTVPEVAEFTRAFYHLADTVADRLPDPE
jgi:hypothetical protein